MPGRLVFDLDPAPTSALRRSVEGAREIHDRLKALGLIGFCKTTGGKGLHVVTPLAWSRRNDWTGLAKAFARELCMQMADRYPDRYLINMTKKARPGQKSTSIICVMIAWRRQSHRYRRALATVRRCRCRCNGRRCDRGWIRCGSRFARLRP